MAAKKAGSKSSSGSDPKSKKVVNQKMEEVMHEFKEGDLTSGKSAQKVTNPKQAIAIGLSEARQAGAKLPPPPDNKSVKPKTLPKMANAKKKKPTRG